MCAFMLLMLLMVADRLNFSTKNWFSFAVTPSLR